MPTDREILIQMISDRSKDAYGSRVRKEYTGWSMDELNAELARYDEIATEEEAREREVMARNLRTWDSHIANLMEDHGIDRATAIRWDRAAMKADDDHFGDFGYYAFLWGMDERKARARAC